MTAALMLTVSTAQTASAADVRSLEWPLQTLQASRVWGISRGAGVTIAVVDSGANANLPDLAGQLLPGANFTGTGSPIGWSETGADGHGTGMTSIIAGSGAANGGNGMFGFAPSVKVLPIAIASYGGGQYGSQLTDGINYAVSRGAGVINLSLGGGETQAVEDAVQNALRHNVVVVAAVGNYGPPVAYPAAYPGVIAVSATDVNGQIWPSSASGPQVTVAAPGVNIEQAMPNGQYGAGSGTSEAAAYTSATVALLRSKYPTYTVGQIQDLLIHTADRKSTAPHDDHYGYGIIDPYAALTTSYVPPPNANPLGIGAAAAPSPTSYYTPGQAVPIPGTAASPDSSGPGTATAPASPAAQGSGESSGMGAVLGIFGGAVVVVGATVGWLLWRRRRTAAAGGPPPGLMGPPGNGNQPRF